MILDQLTSFSLRLIPVVVPPSGSESHPFKCLPVPNWLSSLHELIPCYVHFVIDRFPYSNVGINVSLWIYQHIKVALRPIRRKIGWCSKTGKTASAMHIIWQDSGKIIALKKGIKKCILNKIILGMLSSFLLHFLFKVTGTGWIRRTNEKRRASFGERWGGILCRRLCPGKIKAGSAPPSDGYTMSNRTTRYSTVVSVLIS